MVVADTSGLLAALDETHPDGVAARRVLQTAGTVVVSPVLLSELDHMARRVLGRGAAHQAIDDIARWSGAGRAVMPAVTPSVLDRAQALRKQYGDLRLDLADAVNVVFAAQFGTDVVLTLDHRDFGAIRPLTEHPAFRILPRDG